MVNLDDVEFKVIIPAVLMATTFGLLVWMVWRFWGPVSTFAIVFGLLIGAGLLPAMSTPFFPSPPRLGGMQAMLARVYATITAMALRTPVLVKTRGGEYRYIRGEYDEDTLTFEAEGDAYQFKGAKNRLITFGLRPLALAWTSSHQLFQRIKEDSEVVADGGVEGVTINMGKLHRILRGANNEEIISIAEDDAREHHAGGSDGISTGLMIIIVVLMIIMGASTVWLAIG